MTENIEKAATMTHQQVIAMAINKVKDVVKSCTMTGKVKFGGTKFDYANENDVIKSLRQACVDAGLVVVPSYLSHETDSKGNVVCVMDVKMSHISGAVWPYEIKTAGVCGQNNILGAQTSAMRVWYLKTFHLYTGDDPELITQAEGEAAYVMPPKDKVLKNIMARFPGANEEAREGRLAVLNGCLGDINGEVVISPDKVTNEQWTKIAKGLNL
jgi:hypothetical protein